MKCENGGSSAVVTFVVSPASTCDFWSGCTYDVEVTDSGGNVHSRTVDSAAPVIFHADDDSVKYVSVVVKPTGSTDVTESSGEVAGVTDNDVYSPKGVNATVLDAGGAVLV